LESIFLICGGKNMKLTIELSQTEIEAAISQYLARNPLFNGKIVSNVKFKVEEDAAEALVTLIEAKR
jgi:dihydroxyacetone kinase DhaKLM complex PTS-EIIA-like component DhaM